MNIFELTNQQIEIKKWMERFYDDEDIDEETINKFLEVKELTEDQYLDKIKSYFYLVKHFESQILIAKKEEKRINRIGKVYENSIERLKKVMKESMTLQKRDRIDFATGKIYLKNNPDKLEIVMEDSVPIEFKIVKEEINKRLINEKYKNETELPQWLIRKQSDKSIILK